MSGAGKTDSLREAALAALAAGVGFESFYAELVKLAPPEDREVVALALNLDREFSEFVRRVGDAVEWLLQRQGKTSEPINLAESEIVQEAARRFFVTPEGIAAAFQGNRSRQIKYLEIRGLLATTRMVE